MVVVCGVALTDENGLEGIVDTEVKTTVDEDTDAGDDESTVETTDTVRGNGLSVDVDKTVVLTVAVFALGVVGQSGTGVVKGVDNSQGKGTSETTGGDVGGNYKCMYVKVSVVVRVLTFLSVSGILWTSEHCFDLSLEGKVEGLGWEISDDIGQVTSPEWSDTFFGQDTLGTVHNT